MDPIMALAREYNLQVIEDTAQAIGATYKDKRAAGIGDAGCISFFPSKNLGGYGDGGMVVTDSEQVYQRLLSLRGHGSKKKYFSEEQGWNSRLDELQAAILRVKLRYLDQWSSERRAAAELYDSLLSDFQQVICPKRSKFGSHVFHQYTIRVPNRDAVRKKLGERGVSTMVYYPTPIHLQPIYTELGYKVGDLPVTEAACSAVLSLPMFPELTQDHLEQVVEALSCVLTE